MYLCVCVCIYIRIILDVMSTRRMIALLSRTSDTHTTHLHQTHTPHAHTTHTQYTPTSYLYPHRSQDSLQ